MTEAIIIVDVQNDFCEGGSLPVTGGYDVAHKIKNALMFANLNDVVVVFTRDWHTPGSDNDGHFSDSPDYVDTWPYHCVQGTHGAGYAEPISELQAALKVPYVEIFKGMDEAAYSGFEGETTAGKTLIDVLHEAGVTHVAVCGLAADYCVKSTALHSVKAGFKTNILADLTASINTPVADVMAEIESAQAG